jgi:uncharacterized protein
MSAAPMVASRPGWLVRPPGGYLDLVDRRPAGERPPGLMTGVPAFIGYAEPEPGIFDRGCLRAVVLDRWDAAAFKRSINPGADSFLPMAVRGFFANGGKRCVVLPGWSGTLPARSKN